MRINAWLLAGIVAAGLVQSPGQAHALIMQQGWLADRCAAYLRVTRSGGTTETFEIIHAQECFFYVAGFLDVSATAKDMFPDQRLNFIQGICIPENATASEVVEAIAIYIEQHPLERNWTPTLLLSKAAKETMPCQ